MEKTKRTMLSRPQTFQLAKWIELNHEKLSGKKTAGEAAMQATLELQFPISPSNVVGVAKDVGKPWRTLRYIRAGGRTSQVLARAVLLLANDLDRLAEKLGEQVDRNGAFPLEALVALAKQEVGKETNKP